MCFERQLITMTITLLEREKQDAVDYAVRSYSREEYDSALEHMGTLWAFYRMAKFIIINTITIPANHQ